MCPIRGIMTQVENKSPFLNGRKQVCTILFTAVNIFWKSRRSKLQARLKEQEQAILKVINRVCVLFNLNTIPCKFLCRFRQQVEQALFNFLILGNSRLRPKKFYNIKSGSKKCPSKNAKMVRCSHHRGKDRCTAGLLFNQI